MHVFCVTAVVHGCMCWLSDSCVVLQSYVLEIVLTLECALSHLPEDHSQSHTVGPPGLIAVSEKRKHSDLSPLPSEGGDYHVPRYTARTCIPQCPAFVGRCISVPCMCLSVYLSALHVFVGVSQCLACVCWCISVPYMCWSVYLSALRVFVGVSQCGVCFSEDNLSVSLCGFCNAPAVVWLVCCYR